MSDTLSAPIAVPVTAVQELDHSSEWGVTLARSYDRHGAAVFGLAERVTRHPAVAARLTAEVFAGLGEVTDESTLEECVLVDVHRRAVSWVRQFGRQPRTELSHDALVVLPNAEREVIAAAYFGGLTYSQIAQQLELQPEEVTTLMRDGLRRLNSLSPQRRAVNSGIRPAM
jgi:RNA polymerase sigma-70 factor (ECF subfamily)